jgi:hypothetical protein
MMSDAVTVALIAGGFSVVVQVGSRIMSHFEHKETKQKIDIIAVQMNGGLEDKITAAVKKALE